MGLVNYSKGLYCDPITGDSVSITQAIADGHIKVKMTILESFLNNVVSLSAQYWIFTIFHNILISEIQLSILKILQTK